MAFSELAACGQTKGAVVLRVGIVGFGFMGRMHYRCWNALEGVTVAAVCDADAHAFDDASAGRGNIAGAEGAVDLTDVAIYAELDQMLAAERLDAVSITVPTYLHAASTIAALEASLHVLCEKPMALELADARRMIEVAERTDRILQIGHCMRFWPEYAKAKEIVDAGTYGRVIAATFQRLAATAARKAGGWFTDETRSGGMPLDLHIHDTDFIHSMFGMPQNVCSYGANLSGGGLGHMATRYDYGGDKLVVAEGGWAMMPPFGFQMGFHIAMERATLDFDYRRDPKLRLSTAEGESIAPDCEPGDGYVHEIAHFARRIRGETVATVITPEDAWNSLRIVAAERESIRRGCEIRLEGFGLKECSHAM